MDAAGDRTVADRRHEKPPSAPFVDIIVRVGNPDALHATLAMLSSDPARVVGCGEPEGPLRLDDGYVVRAGTNWQFIEWAMRQQGYAQIVLVLPLNCEAARWRK